MSLVYTSKNAMEDEYDVGILNDDFYNAQDWMEEVLHQVFRIGDEQLLKNALEELAHLLQVKYPHGPTKFTKKPNALFDDTIKLLHDQH